ncbi:MAG TPA: universal stress protein [Thermoanaerobaculia bacterium]|nr:universal stress protein [Thermoanaerobaculia bacterium]
MDTFRPNLILVATDFSKAAAHALRYASAIAERLVARLIVVYADEFIPPFDDERKLEASLASGRMGNSIAAAQERLVAHVEENVSTCVPFDARVIVDSPISAIVKEARECGAGLLVMGTQGRTGVRRLIVGSVCESVMRAVSIPVMAVSMAAADHESLAIHKVVCIVDQSPECAAALRIAAAMAPEARLILLNPREEERPIEAAERLMRLRRWLPAELVDRCELRLVDAGWSAEHMADFAAIAGADLIVAGGQRSRGVTDRFRGTTTDRIVQRSECPVLVV